LDSSFGSPSAAFGSPSPSFGPASTGASSSAAPSCFFKNLCYLNLVRSTNPLSFWANVKVLPSGVSW
jgi:hypothetical protein